VKVGEGPPAPRDERYEDYVERIARGASVSSAGQVAGRLCNYATQASLALLFGPAQLGFYALGVTLVQVANVLSQVGLDNGVVRFVARYRTEGDQRRIRGTVLLSLGMGLLLSVILSLALFFGAEALASEVFGKPFMEPTIRAFSVSLPLLTVMSVALWATQGFGTVKYQTWVRDVARPLANLALVFVFYLLGVEVLGAVAAYAISMAGGAVLALLYLRRVFPDLTDPAVRPEYEGRALLSTSVPTMAASATQNLNGWLALLVLGAFETASEVGVYSVAYRTAVLSSLVLIAFGSIFSPLVASLHNERRSGDLAYLYRDVSRWTFTGGLAFFLLSVLLARDVVALFGPGFEDGWIVLVIVAAAGLFGSSVGPTARILAMTGQGRAVLLATVASVLTAAALNALLVPAFGMVGAAAATATALTVANTTTAFFVFRRLGLWPYNVLYARPIAAGLLASTAVLGLKALLPLSGPPALLLYAPAFLTVFVGWLLLLGLGPSDRRFVGALSGAFLGQAKSFRARLGR
jgi:O-antigen/teichoic acid export membrane protein